MIEPIKSVGKACKFRVMHLTEWQAGMLFLSALALNIALVTALALQ
jgi:uncharacterized membrane protein|tara:strand:- start:213 stop:350 length:138 start_codon:yes stop_codon:yes gene_type:complete